MSSPVLPPSHATRAGRRPWLLGRIGDDSRGMRLGAGPCMVTSWWTGRAGGRDGDGRPAAAVWAVVAGLPGRSRPAPQLQGGHGVVPRLRPALAAGRGRAVPLARPGPAVGPGGQRAGGVPLPCRPSVNGAAGGDRAGPLRTEPATTLAGWTTARDLAALQAWRGGRDLGAARPCRCDGPVLGRSGHGVATGSTGHMDHGDDGALGLVPGRDHLRRQQQQLHLAAAAL
jgi:hypothetical protein